VHFLLLKIASAVGLGLVLRHADARKIPRLPLVRINYAVTAVLAFLAAVAAGQTSISRTTGLFAAVTGALFVAGLLVWIRAMAAAGLALSVTTMRTAIVVPVLASALFWRERPAALELVGGGVALLALGLVLSEVMGRSGGRAEANETAGGERGRSAGFWLVLLFLADGLVMTAAQVFRHEMPQAETLPFQAVLFVSAFAVTSIIYFARRERVDRRTLNLGALLGAANLGNHLFLVLALSVLPGIAVYPAIAAGEVGLSAAAGVIFWREKVGVRSWVGIGLTVAALLLIQLGRSGAAAP
jgi:drug/metabolite transporter (DMT)-like permease